MTEFSTDVLVIGAGPTGLFSVFECGMVGLKTHVVDPLDMVGGQCSALYPEKPIYDIPGFPSIAGQALIDQLAAQAAPFNPQYHLGAQVVGLDVQTPGVVTATLSTGVVITARSVIIAAGVGAFGPNRPPLDGLDEYEGKSIFYYVTRREDFRDKRVVIAGGGDSAVDWAISLSEVAAKVMVVHRRPKFRAAPDSEAKLHALAEQGVIDLVVPYQLKGLQGHNGALSHVMVESLEGEVRALEADCLLPFYGLSMNLGPILEWGLALEKNHIVVDQSTCRTSCPGIYAIGDIATYPHKLKLILTGFAEGAQAAHHIRSYLYPDEHRHFEYSTTKGVP